MPANFFTSAKIAKLYSNPSLEIVVFFAAMELKNVHRYKVEKKIVVS
jgi:hypothetical protein